MKTTYINDLNYLIKCLHFKLKSARRNPTTGKIWITLEGQEEGEWFVDFDRPDVPEGFVALQHWCSGSYRWASAEAIEKLLEAKPK